MRLGRNNHLRKALDSSIEQLEESTENLQEDIEKQTKLKEIVNVFKQYNDVQGKLKTLK